MKFFYTIVYFISLTLIFSCNTLKNEYSTKLISNTFIISFTENNDGVFCKINSIYGRTNEEFTPDYYIKGNILVKNAKILLLSRSYTDTTTLFDFDLKEKKLECVSIYLGISNEEFIKHCYYLTLDSVYKIHSKNEKIYKFTWENFSLFDLNELDKGFVQFYFSDKRGVIGLSAGYYGEDFQKDITFFGGEQFDSTEMKKFIIKNPVIM